MSELSAFGRIGPPHDPTAATGTNPPEDPISLAEYEATDPFEISEADAEFLESFSEDDSATPLTITYERDGRAVITADSHVGTVTLPSGVQIDVRPKETVSRLLWALQYAFDTPVDSLNYETEFAEASSFFDTLAVLFGAELESVLDSGLHQDYVRRRTIEESVTGRIDVQRQLQRPTAVTTDFAVERDAHTTDVLLNRAVYAALRILLRLVVDPDLTNRLRHLEGRLRQFVTPDNVSLADVERIELSRLNDHYGALLSLTRTVLAREFFEDVRAGEQRSLALFVDMDDVFERIVERSFQNAAREVGRMTVERQASIPNVVDGPHAVSMRPDVLVRRDDGSPVVVADAKWKTGSSSSGDVYQLTSYILGLKVPGVLVYPAAGRTSDLESTVNGTHSLRTVELPMDATVGSYEEYVHGLEDTVRSVLDRVSNGEQAELS